MKNLSIVLIIFLGLSVFQSCDPNDEMPPKGENVAPDLPPAESFIMPFTGFEDADTTGYLPNDGEGATTRTTTFHNWFYSATNVVVWNTVLTLNLAIPVASFIESFNHNPTFEGNATWLWAYSVTGDDGAIYEAKLYGEILAIGEVQWDMYISKVGGFSDIHWYSGLTSNDNTIAVWNINHQPNNPQSFIRIDYEKNNGNGLAVIRYTNNIPNNAGNGGYIEHRMSNDASATYNKNYDIFRIENNNLLEIQWNKMNKTGRVKDELKYGNPNWHCWDIDLQDTEC